MFEFVRNLPSYMTSLAVHALILVALLLITLDTVSGTPDVVLESVFTDELPPDVLEQDLEIQTTPADTMNVVSGGTPSTAVGAAAQPTLTPVNVQQAEVMQEANVRPVLTDLTLPSDELMAEELGEGEVTGEVGAIVDGYGSAMGIITQEIIRMMRKQKVTVVWLFDESESLVDDRQEIRENYLRVYDELGMAANQDKALRRESELLLTVVASYGETIHEHTQRPTADVEKIKEAIDRVPTDATGTENMCQSISAIISSHQRLAKAGRRKLAVIVVSDESGDDGNYVEDAIAAARSAKAPVYMLGRESVFGYPYGRQRWVHEESGEVWWLPIRRGPETAFPECLQWNGLHGRWDAQSAGFGPYEQVRIAKETGGIFFVLPGEEANLVGYGGIDRRKYDFLAMREYQPLLLARRDYLRERAASQFRNTLFSVISRLNPTENKLLFDHHDDQLNIWHEHFPLDPPGFAQRATVEVQKAARAYVLNDEAIQILENIKPLREKEASQRWRAGFDLTYAQLHIFRLRLYQFLMTVDDHYNDMPKPADPRSNTWDVWWDRRKLVPDDAQFARLKQTFNLPMNRDEYLAMVAEEEQKSLGLLDQVIAEHPGTPWARRAQQEKNDGFGFRVADRLWDPNNIRAVIEQNLPNL